MNMAFMKRWMKKILSWYDVIVVGGGAAGMMAAGTAAQNGLHTLLLEKNNRLGRKLRITGKGRCNIVNDCDVTTVIESIPSNGRFLYGAISQFTPADAMRFFENQGVPVKTERGNRVFPQSDKAADVVEALKHYCIRNGAEIQQETVQDLLIHDSTAIGVRTESGMEYQGGHVVVACGGMSFSATGSTGDGYRLAQQAGHTITELRPSLVSLVANGRDCPALQGLSLKNVAITVCDLKTKKQIYNDFGEMMFTHYGVTGPIILSASSHMRQMEPNRYQITIDLKPALSLEQLNARLQRDFGENQNKDFVNSLGALLPRKLIPVMVAKSGIAPDQKCNQIKKEQRHMFAQKLKALKITIKGFRPINEAIVTSGGVSVKEISPKTMESKLVRGLYFAGEVIDVDAYTGGFNLQIAFSTGYLAATSIALAKCEL